jgi:hypothetical protein
VSNPAGNGSPSETKQNSANCRQPASNSGYRVLGSGHHLATFEALEIAMGQPVSALAAYFDTCRRKQCPRFMLVHY